MQRSGRLPKGIYAAIALLAAIYAAFLLLDTGALGVLLDTRALKFASIVICFGMACLWGRGERTDKVLLCAAMLLTVCADACLLLWNQYLPGVVCFCFVQTLYCIRHDRAAWPRTLAFLALAAAALAALWLLLAPSLPTLFLAGCIYAAALVTSVCKALGALKYARFGRAKAVCVSAGMALFLCCDICVALYNISLETRVFVQAGSVAVILSWVFYLPSQTLLALSGILRPKN